MCRFSFVEEKFDNDKDIKAHKQLLYDLDEKHGYISLTEAKEIIERLIAGEELSAIEDAMYFRIF